MTYRNNRTAPRRRPGAALASVLSLAAACGGCDPADGGGDGGLSQLDATVPPTFVAHKAREGKVTLKAPPAWKATATTGAVVLNLKTERPGSSVNLVVVPASPGEGVDTVMTKFPDLLAKEYANFTLSKKDVLILHDLPAGRFVYEASRGGFHGKLMQVVMVKGGTDYVLTYTASPEEFDKDLPEVEQVLASVELP